MPEHLVRAVLEKARSFDAVSCAVTFLTSARVVAYINLTAARQMLAEGMERLDALQLPSRQDARLAAQVPALACPADSALAVTYYKKQVPEPYRPEAGGYLLRALAEHGDVGLAMDIFADSGAEADNAFALLPLISGRDHRAQVLRIARERSQPWPPGRALERNCPYRLLARYFADLPREEAREWTEELLLELQRQGEETPDYEPEDPFRLRGPQDFCLFLLLPALRVLYSTADVERLLRDRPAVRKAATFFPDGLGRRVGLPGRNPGSPATEHRLAEAHRMYCADLHFNGAPRALWTSGHAYCNILHEAAVAEGWNAQRYLGEVPDTVLAGRATIEFVAGLLGVEAYPGLRCYLPMEPPMRLRGGPGAWPVRGAGAA